MVRMPVRCLVWLVLSCRTKALVVPMPNRRRQTRRRREESLLCLRAKLVSHASFLPMVLGARLTRQHSTADGGAVVADGDFEDDRETPPKRRNRRRSKTEDVEASSASASSASASSSSGSKAKADASPQESELSLLRDQNRALRLVVSTLQSEVERLRERETANDELMKRCQAAEANATRLSAEVAKTERLRKRAASEVNHLRGRTRDVLARNAELEATAVVSKTTSHTGSTPEERALRIHSKRRRSSSNDDEEETTPFSSSSRRKNKVFFSARAFFGGGDRVDDDLDLDDDDLDLDDDDLDLDDDDLRRQRYDDPFDVLTVKPLRKAAPRKAVLVPELGDEYQKAAPSSAVSPDQELLLHKLSRGSTIYQKLQSELARHIVERKYGTSYAKSNSAVSLYNATKAAAKHEILESLYAIAAKKKRLDDNEAFSEAGGAKTSSEKKQQMKKRNTTKTAIAASTTASTTAAIAASTTAIATTTATPLPIQRRTPLDDRDDDEPSVRLLEDQDYRDDDLDDLYGHDDDDTILSKLHRGSTLYLDIRQQQVKEKLDPPPKKAPKKHEVRYVDSAPPPPPPEPQPQPASLSELFADDFALTATPAVPKNMKHMRKPFFYDN